jgi:hypothetical protein
LLWRKRKPEVNRNLISRCFAITPANKRRSATQALWELAEGNWEFGANILNGTIIKTINALAINLNLVLNLNPREKDYEQEQV